MANANTSPSRIGQINGAGDVTSLFLKKFAGEVLTTFTTNNVMKDLTTVRTISNGKSAQFPATGIATAKYHTAGENIADAGNSYLSLIKANEVVINIDSMLLSSSFIANIDEAMNHYDVRSIYTTEIGRALAQKFDKTLLQVTTLGASKSSTITGGNGGSVQTVTGASLSAVTGANLAAAIYKAAQTLDEKNIPSEDRVCVTTPQQYYSLVQFLSTPNTAYSPVGSYVSGDVAMIAGIRIVKSNNLPTSSISADTGANNTYNGDFSKNVAVVFHKSAVGTVKLLDLAVESEYQIERQGTLMVAKYAMGHGVLRPEGIVQLAIA